MYDLIGKTLGKYQIIEQLHQTAVTDVYKGFHPVMNRYVVVNVLKAEFNENQAILQRFLNQNDIAAKIQHPNLLPMIDYGEENGIYYRVLVYGPEGNWSENKRWFNNHPAIVRLFSQLAAALSQVHSFGHVYLNLRPVNIFFGDGRTAMLGDFGIALSPEFSRNDPFCSPEVNRQEPFDHRADIYALGVLLYELLTGNPPDMERYVSLSIQRPDLPEDVEKVILKALSDRPEDRFQSVNTFQSALEAAFRYTDKSTDVSVISPVQQPEKRKGWLIALVTVLILLCLGAITVFALTRAGGDEENGVVSEATVEAPAQPTPEQPAPTLEQPAPPPEDPGQMPPEDEDRPGIELPDFNLPPISEIPFCNSVIPAAGMGMVGIIALKRKKKTSAKDDGQIDLHEIG